MIDEGAGEDQYGKQQGTEQLHQCRTPQQFVPSVGVLHEVAHHDLVQPHGSEGEEQAYEPRGIVQLAELCITEIACDIDPGDEHRAQPHHAVGEHP